MKLIDKISEMYKNDKVSLDIFNSIENILTELADCVNNIERQRLLNYSTWYLENIEAELGITEAAEFEERCKIVKLKLLTRGKVSVQGAEEICKGFVTYVKTVYSAEKFTLNITLGKINNVDFDKLKREIRNYIPAHIFVTYATYQRSHQELSTYTHQELREKDIL